MVALLADKGQLFDLDGARLGKAVPSFTGNEIRFLRLLLGRYLNNGHVRHIGPLFFVRQSSGIELIVEVSQPLRRMTYADEYRRRRRDESFHLAEGSLKRFHLTTNVGKRLKGCGFSAL